MALSNSSPHTSTADAPNWVDYYVKNRNDGGPIQALFNQTLGPEVRVTPRKHRSSH